jgi:hypothetical protein
MIPRTASEHKQALVSLGLYALSHGEWGLVMAITRLVQSRGLTNE